MLLGMSTCAMINFVQHINNFNLFLIQVKWFIQMALHIRYKTAMILLCLQQYTFIIIQGAFVDNEYHGNGVFLWPDGATFTGQFANNRYDLPKFTN